MKKPIISIIENPLHNHKQYKHKFGSKSSLDRYMNHPDRTHLKVIEIRNVTDDDKLPFTLK